MQMNKFNDKHSQYVMIARKIPVRKYFAGDEVDIIYFV